MAAPKMRLIDVDENYVPPKEGATREQQAWAQQAAHIKEGRRRERKDQEIERVKAAAAHAAAIKEHSAALKAAEDAYRVAASTAHKAGHAHGFWKGVGVGGVIFGALACIAIFAMQGVIWDTATRAFREQAMTGALLSTQDDGRP